MMHKRNRGWSVARVMAVGAAALSAASVCERAFAQAAPESTDYQDPASGGFVDSLATGAKFGTMVRFSNLCAASRTTMAPPPKQRVSAAGCSAKAANGETCCPSAAPSPTSRSFMVPTVTAATSSSRIPTRRVTRRGGRICASALRRQYAHGGANFTAVRMEPGQHLSLLQPIRRRLHRPARRARHDSARRTRVPRWRARLRTTRFATTAAGSTR